jgi:hypothetical protein
MEITTTGLDIAKRVFPVRSARLSQQGKRPRDGGLPRRSANP